MTVTVLLVGLGITTLTALESLIAKCQVVGLVRPMEPGEGEQDAAIALAQQSNIPIYTDTSQRSIQSLVLSLQPDCVVVSSYHRIFPAELIQLSTFVNVHYSPLPQYRGRANVNWAIINDESHAAISIHKISPDLDEGNILFQALIPIHATDTVADLYDRLNQLQRQHLGDTVLRLFQGDHGTPQQSSDATYGCTRLPEDGEIQWADSTRKIDCLIRALVAPFPGAYTYLGGEKLVIWRAQPVESAPKFVGRIPGRIIGRSLAEGYVDVLTGDGVLRLLEVQMTGEDVKAAASVIKSVKSTLGLRSLDLLQRIHRLEQEVLRLKNDAK